MLDYSRAQSHRDRNPILERGTAIVPRRGGFSYVEPEIQIPGTRGVSFDLPDNAVAFGHTHTVQENLRLNRLNELPTLIDIDNTALTGLPQFILTPTDRVIRVDILGPGVGWYEVRGRP